MEITKTIDSLKSLITQARAAGKTIGLVPTMGALHAGHVSLIEQAKKQTDFVIVSIFVNPIQFGPNEDYEKYPRTLNADEKACQSAGVDAIFAPAFDQIYPKGNISWVTVEKFTETLCGQSRPEHFKGVTTVCAKLFDIVNPDKAFFGQKDAQQTIIIKKMVEDLNMPLEIIVCPTIRESDGLALSSRNKYLSPSERKDAALMYVSLQTCEKLIKQGQSDPKIIIGEARQIIEQSPLAKVEYLAIVNAKTLEELKTVTTKTLIAAAVKFGDTRLIDNILVEPAN